MLQQILMDQGYSREAPTGSFLRQTFESVVFFQQTHIGKDGNFLNVDGVVGERTKWAINNPSGDAQRSFIKAEIPAGLGPTRREVLELAVAEYNNDVAEDPDGSCWGSGIDKYGGTPGSPWACFFWSWCVSQKDGRFPLRAKFGQTKSAWHRAKALDKAHDKNGYCPIPGDACIIHTQINGKFVGKGHIGIVLRVEMQDGVATRINTIEGKFGNRLKVAVRDLSDRNLIGFINQYPEDEQQLNFESGVFETGSAAAVK